MPLLKRLIQPTHVSRVPLVQELVRDESGRVFPVLMPATDPPQDLEAFTNLTLANLITQLSSLSRHAEDLFGEMIADSTAIMNRTISLQGRVDKLAVKVKNLDSNVEEVSLQDIHMRKAFKSSTLFDQQVVSRDTVPAAMLEIYTQCDRPPPLDQLNPYRDDGKDGLKFYTDPAYFFNLWREEMTKETEQLKDNKTKPGKPKGDGRKKNKVRQACNTRDKHKQLAIAKGEHIAEGHYKQVHPGQEVDGKHSGNINHRPNSIELTGSNATANDHQPAAPHHTTTHHQNDHPTYITNSSLANNDSSNLSPHHQQQLMQQQHMAAGNNGAAGGQQIQGYGTAGSYPQSYLNQENFGIYGQTTYNPAENGDSSQAGTPNRNLPRVTSNRPSQPPPAPPGGDSSTPPPPSHSGTPTRSSQQGAAATNNRETLPPPPLPPVADGAGIMRQQPDLLPSVPPVPDSNGTTAGGGGGGGDMDLPHPSPPPPMLPTAENGGAAAAAAAAPPLPPTPPPPPMLNGALAGHAPPPIPNGDIMSNIGSQIAAVTLKPAPKKKPPKEMDPRCDLLKAIRDGIKLRKVDDTKPSGGGSGGSGRGVEEPNVDVASILQRRFAFEVSDSDTSSGDTDSDSDDWDETSA